MQNIPENTQDLSTKNGYFQRFFKLLPYFKKGEEAFNHLESEYKEKYHRNKYKNYETFRASKSIHFGK